MDCGGCPQEQPMVAAGNQPIWWLYRRLRPMLRDGLGGINGPGIEAGFRMQRVPPRAQPELLSKLLVLLSESAPALPGDGDGE